jgi:hypothetical protein
MAANINQSIDDYYNTGIVDAVKTMPDGPIKDILTPTVLTFLNNALSVPGLSLANRVRIQDSIYDILGYGDLGRRSPAPAAGGRRKSRKMLKTRSKRRS